MSTLDQIIQMQGQGLSDTEIATQLQNNGVSPQEINDSLNQAKIKSAVSPQENIQQPQQPQASAQPAPIPEPEIYPPQTMEQPQQDYYQPTPQAYSQQDQYAPQQTIDPETISEIAEQVVAERLNEFTRKTGDIASFKNTIQDKVADIDERLKRIENSIDKLQQAVIGKIGEFQGSNEMIHKDLDNLHGTVSKLMNPLVDNINEMKKISK